MKHIRLLPLFIAAVMSVSGCAEIYTAEIHDVTVDPYKPLSGDDIKFGECQITFGDGVSVNGQGAWYKDNDIVISKGGIYKLSGSYSLGCINVTTTEPVKLVLSDADISSSDSYAVVSSAERLVIVSDGESVLTGRGGEYENAVYSEGGVLVEGTGSLCIDGGIISRGNIKFGREVSVACEILTSDNSRIITGVLDIN